MSDIEFAKVTNDETGICLRIWKDDEQYSFLVEDVLEAMVGLVAMRRRIKDLESHFVDESELEEVAVGEWQKKGE